MMPKTTPKALVVMVNDSPVGVVTTTRAMTSKTLDRIRDAQREKQKEKFRKDHGREATNADFISVGHVWTTFVPLTKVCR